MRILISAIIVIALMGCGGGGGGSSDNKNNSDSGNFIIDTGIKIDDKTIPAFNSGDNWDYVLVDGTYDDGSSKLTVTGSGSTTYYDDSYSTNNYGDLDKEVSSFDLNLSDGTDSSSFNSNSTTYQQQDSKDNSIGVYGNSHYGMLLNPPVIANPGTLDTDYAVSMDYKYENGRAVSSSFNVVEKQLVEIQGSQYKVFKFDISVTETHSDGKASESSLTIWYSTKIGASVRTEKTYTQYLSNGDFDYRLNTTYELTGYSI